MLAPHEICKGAQLPAITGSTTRRTRSAAVAPQIKINRIAKHKRTPPDFVTQFSLVRVFKLGVVVAMIPVAHKASAPVDSAIPAKLRTVADLSLEPVAAEPA